MNNEETWQMGGVKSYEVIDQTKAVSDLSMSAGSDFDLWWSAIGSTQRPSKTQDVEEFAKCMCEWAWESARETYSRNAQGEVRR